MTVRWLALLAFASFASFALVGGACGTTLVITPDATGTLPGDDGGGSESGAANDAAVSLDAGTDGLAPSDGAIDAAPDGSTGATCTGRVCNIGACVAGECERLVFVTTDAYAIGGNNHPRNVDEADSICQSLADSHGLKNTFRAWLSNSSQYPADGVRFTQSTRPYKLMDGTMIATSFGDLIDGTLLAPINRDVGNLGVAGAFVWTGTRVDGTRAPNGSCTSWSNDTTGTASAGDVASTTSGWTEQSLPCTSMGHFYCFEQ